MADCEAGIESFQLPDKWSRTEEHEGRRIEKIEGGWRLLNYDKYREMRDAETTRESKREYMRRERASSKVEQSGKSGTPWYQAEAEAEAEKKIKTPLASKLADLSGFDQFWNAYPKKQAKQKAQQAWAKIKPDTELQSAIARGLIAAIASEQWRKDAGQFIPHAATWLNGKRWTDSQTAEIAAQSRMGKFVI